MSKKISNEMIIETECFDEISKHVSPNTIVFCDLDNTLIESAQQFGSVQWGDHYTKKLIESGESPEKAEEIAQKLWFKIQPSLSMRLVDIEVPNVIQNIQTKGCPVLGLTARYPEEAPYTHPHLYQAGIRFDHPELEHFKHESASYEKGIIFCSWLNKKSEVLMAFLKQLNWIPEKIIFIDDKLEHIHDLQEALAPLNVDYVGIRLSKTDQRVREYDIRVAAIQSKHFPSYISDEEAHKLLLSRKELS